MMNNEQAISKTSYYCQSIYTTINLFNDLVENRNYKLLNDLLIKIIEDTSQCINYYSQIKYNIMIIDNINHKLELLMDGYKNSDYFYIKDIFSYELIPIINEIFDELKKSIMNKNE